MTTSRAYLALPIVAVLAVNHEFGSSRQQFLLEEGNDLYTAEKYEEAIGLFEEFLELDPTNWTANYLTAASYLALYHPGSEDPKDQEYLEKGLAAFERTLGLAPPSLDQRKELEERFLRLLVTSGDRAKAIAFVETQLVSRPDDLTLNNQLGTLYQQNGEFSKAITYFEKRAIIDSGNKEAWLTLGMNCWARSYHGGSEVTQEEREQVVEKGILAFDKALAIDPDYFDALAYINLVYREKAKALAAIGREVEAGEAFDKAADYQKQAIELRKAQQANAKAK